MYNCFFDVDGVMLDFERGFTKAVKDYFKLDVADDFVSKSFWFSDLLTKEQVMEGWDYFLHSSNFEELHPIVDPDTFNSAFGAYPVHFVTNIPLDCLDRREKNLRKAGFKFDSAHCAGFIDYDGYSTKTKAEIIQELHQEEKTVLFVDDHPDNCLNVLESFPEAEIWLMSRPFNEDFNNPEIRRAGKWADILEHTGTVPLIK